MLQNVLSEAIQSHFIVLAEVVRNKVTQDLQILYFLCEHFVFEKNFFDFYCLHFYTNISTSTSVLCTAKMCFFLYFDISRCREKIPKTLLNFSH